MCAHCSPVCTVSGSARKLDCGSPVCTVSGSARKLDCGSPVCTVSGSAPKLDCSSPVYTVSGSARKLDCSSPVCTVSGSARKLDCSVHTLKNKILNFLPSFSTIRHILPFKAVLLFHPKLHHVLTYGCITS